LTTISVPYGVDPDERLLYEQQEKLEAEAKKRPKTEGKVKFRTRVPRSPSGGKIYVRAAARPDIDEKQLADVLLDLAPHTRAEQEGRAA
jgi:hypothetical protein